MDQTPQPAEGKQIPPLMMAFAQMTKAQVVRALVAAAGGELVIDPVLLQRCNGLIVSASTDKGGQLHLRTVDRPA